MTERDPTRHRPLEEEPEVAAAVDAESTVPRLRDDGGPGPANPTFRDVDDPEAEFPPTDTLLGAPNGAGSGYDAVRTGAEQPWEPEDLTVAQGHDPTPGNVDRARRELEREGPTAVEKIVP
jgi:hypothetical protein